MGVDFENIPTLEPPSVITANEQLMFFNTSIPRLQFLCIKTVQAAAARALFG
jgi:hypothetical protein